MGIIQPDNPAAGDIFTAAVAMGAQRLVTGAIAPVDCTGDICISEKQGEGSEVKQ